MTLPDMGIGGPYPLSPDDRAPGVTNERSSP